MIRPRRRGCDPPQRVARSVSDHGHDGRGGRFGAALREGFAPHSHDASDSIDGALESSAAGIRAVKISLLALGATSIAQLVIVVISGSVALLADTIHNFDASNDSFTFSGIAIAGNHIEYVATGALMGAGQASAHLQSNGPGNDYLQVDTNGDGQSDMDISLLNLNGTLHNSNFLLT